MSTNPASDIMVTKPYLPPFAEYVDELRDLWDTASITNQGVKHRCLQQQLENFLDVPHAELFANGHLALEAAISIFQPDGEIITTPFTFASTVQAILRSRCTPVFCDINAYDYTIDVSKIEALITEKTRAILPVHVYGNICDVEAIAKLADKYSLKVIYDAAHAFGETYKGVSIANFGDAVMFSFHATKSFHTVEGGCVAYKNDSYTEPLQAVRQFGQIPGTENYPYSGGNAKMSEFHAAMGLCNLRHYAEFTEQRRAGCSIYREALHDVPGLRLLRHNPDVVRNYTYFPVLIDEIPSGVSRDMVLETLKEHRVYPRKYFSPLCSDFAVIKSMGLQADTPTAGCTADRILALPCYAGLTAEQVQSICSILLSLYNR